MTEHSKEDDHPETIQIDLEPSKRELSDHYLRYRETHKRCAKAYVQNNREKVNTMTRNYYNTNPAYRAKKLIKMRDLQRTKRAAERAAKLANKDEMPDEIIVELIVYD